MLNKKHVYRVGDRVRVLRPRWIKRIGYALVWTDLIDEVNKDPRSRAAMEILGVPPRKYVLDPESEYELPHEFARAIAMHRVAQRGFGGDQRQIMYLDGPFGWQGERGAVLEVYRKSIRKTGTRFPATGGVTYGWDGPDDWYEPGGLTDEKTHIILHTAFGDIEACDVEPVL